MQRRLFRFFHVTFFSEFNAWMFLWVCLIDIGFFGGSDSTTQVSSAGLFSIDRSLLRVSLDCDVQRLCRLVRGTLCHAL